MIERCRVRKLQLTARDEASAQRAQHLIAAALRLASFPHEGMPGWLLIRRLDLGVISCASSPERLAAEITRLAQRWGGLAVPFAVGSLRAAQAEVVWLRSAAEAPVELVRAVCRSQLRDFGAWFWPRLIPGLAAGTQPAQALRLAVQALVQLPDARVVVTELLRLLWAEAVLERFTEQLSAHEDRLLWQLYAAAPASTSPGAAPASTTLADVAVSALPELIPDRPLCALLERSVAQHGAEHPRSLWLCHSALLWSAPGLQDSAPGSAALVARAMLARVRTRAVAASQRADVPRPLELPQPDSAAETAAASPGAEPARAERVGARANRSQERQDAPAWAQTEGALPSAYAGLPFVLSVLRRLQIEAFLREHPGLVDCQLATRLLARVAARLEIPERDPMWLLLKLTTREPVRAPFVAPPVWWPELVAPAGLRLAGLAADAPASVVLTPEGMPVALFERIAPAVLAAVAAGPFAVRPEPYPRARELEVVLDAWQCALERWLAHYTQLDVRELVVRDGGISLSRTHLDVIFDLEQADVRVRRAALDIDPGYLPWFGKVVTYHYVRGFGA